MPENKSHFLVLQFLKRKFEFTGPNQILEFFYVYIQVKTETFAGLGPEDRYSSRGLGVFHSTYSAIFVLD